MKYLIVENGNSGYLVKVYNSERYNDGTIVFEGITYKECVEYVARNSKDEAVRLQAEKLNEVRSENTMNTLSKEEKSEIVNLIKLVKEEAYNKIESILNHLFSCVSFDYTLRSDMKGNEHITLEHGMYKIVIGYNTVTGKVIRKNKDMMIIDRQDGVTF